MSKAGDQIRSIFFKQVPGGYVFRAPKPWVFGRSVHYLVSEAQRNEIVPIMTPRRPMLLLAIWIGGFVLAVGASLVGGIVVAPDYPVTVSVISTGATLLVAVVALHRSASRKLRRLQPALAGAPQTDQRITITDMRGAQAAALGHRQLLFVCISHAFACVVSAATAAVQIYLRKHNATVLSDPLPVLFGFNALIFGISFASNLQRLLRQRMSAEPTGPAVEPAFAKISARLMSACAVAVLVFLAASAVAGMNREFSDLTEGLRYESKGEHDKAIASFSKAIEAEPANADAYVERAKSYSAKGDHDRAIVDYTKAIEAEPGDADIYRKRADAYRAKGASDNAIADYSKAIALDPKDALAYYFRGVSYAANKSNDRAIADFTRALEIKPSDAYSYASRARSFEAKGDHDHADADFSKAIEINPNYYYAYFFRGFALAARGQHDRAIADFTKAIEINPKNEVAYRMRASAYAATRGDALAIADYRTILDLPALTEADRQARDYARQRLDQLTSKPLASGDSSTNAPALAPR